MQTWGRFLGFALAGVILGGVPAGAPSLRAVQAAERDAEPGRQARDVAERAQTKVVVLRTTRERLVNDATGFLVSPRLVITAGHAVRSGVRPTAWLNGVSYSTSLLAVHPDHDFAALELRAPSLLLKPLELADTSTDLRSGEALVILAGAKQVGRGTGDPRQRVALPAIYQDRVTLRLSNGKPGPLLKMDASVERGDSGSPVIRVRDGQVVGVLSSRELPDANGVSHTAFAAPVETLRAWLAGLSPTSGQDLSAPIAPGTGGEEFYLERLAR
jgi:S1-C subfamily serine protease